MMSVEEVVRRLKIGRDAVARWPVDSAQWNYYTGYVRALTEILSEEADITTDGGVLYRDGKMLDCQGADYWARRFGFQFAEELVAALRGISP